MPSLALFLVNSYFILTLVQRLLKCYDILRFRKIFKKRVSSVSNRDSLGNAESKKRLEWTVNTNTISLQPHHGDYDIKINHEDKIRTEYFS